ncbi:MAG: exodeoxyribonuclease VII large subunit [Acidimicrobiales bacterium]
MTLPLWGDRPPRGDDGPVHGPANGPANGRGSALPTPPTRREQGPRLVSLVQLSREIARSLATVGRVAVEGEVYRPHKSQGGWVFFVLKDRSCQVSVVCPARNARRCRAVEGERVLVAGSLMWANDRGQVTLEAEEVSPVGEGAVAAMIAEIRSRLAAEGILGRPRRPLPRLPRLIGVVCGTDAAVRKDIESVVAARFPGYPVVFEETSVSGPGAALSIVDALKRLARRPGVDVVVLARGGGDATALLPWSDEDLCRQVAATPVPVVSAIGHEGDRPLCDDVADLRCGTPSIAAHTVVPDRRALEDQLAELLDSASRSLEARRLLGRERLRGAEISGALTAGMEHARTRLGHAQDRLSWADPRRGAELCRRRLTACDWRAPLIGQLGEGHRRLEAARRHAWSLSPQHVVERGFAIARKLDGTVVRDPAQVQAGERLDLQVARGTIEVRAGKGEAK